MYYPDQSCFLFKAPTDHSGENLQQSVRDPWIKTGTTFREFGGSPPSFNLTDTPPADPFVREILSAFTTPPPSLVPLA